MDLKVKKSKIETDVCCVECQICHMKITGRTEKVCISNFKQHYEANHKNLIVEDLKNKNKALEKEKEVLKDE